MANSPKTQLNVNEGLQITQQKMDSLDAEHIDKSKTIPHAGYIYKSPVEMRAFIVDSTVNETLPLLKAEGTK